MSDELWAATFVFVMVLALVVPLLWWFIKGE